MSANNTGEDHGIEIMVPCEPGGFLEPRDVTYSSPLTLPDGTVVDLNAPGPFATPAPAALVEDGGSLVDRLFAVMRSACRRGLES